MGITLKKDSFGRLTKQMFISTLLVMTISELSGATTAVIDGILTSHFLGDTAMAAFGLAAPYFSIVCIFSGVIMVGCQNVLVELIARSKKDEASGALTLSLTFGFCIALLLTILGFLCPQAYATLFGATKGNGLLDLTSDYLRGVFIGAPFWVVFVILIPVLQLCGQSVRCWIGTIVCAVVDVVFDLLNIFVLKWGILGMGLATALSHISGCLILVSYFLKKDKMFKITFKNFNIKELKDIVKEGTPRATCMIGRTIGPIILNIIVIAVGGSIAVSALSIQRSFSFLAASVGWGVGGALLMLGSMYFIEIDTVELKNTTLLTLKCILFIILPLAIIFFLISPLLADVYCTEHNDVYYLSIKALRWFSLSLPFLAFNVAFANYFQAVKKNIYSNIINFSIECVSLVLTALVFSLKFGVGGFFSSFFFGQVFIALIIIVITLIKQKKETTNRYAHISLDPVFDLDDEMYITKKITTDEDAVEFSTEINTFLKERNVDKKHIYAISLCAEELACNIISRGFTKVRRDCIIEGKLTKKIDKIILTIKDNASPFDLVEKSKSWDLNPENPEKNLGTRMALLHAENIKYSGAININALTITWDL